NRTRRVRDFLERDRGDPRPEIREDVRARNCFEITNLVRDVRDAVVLEHQARVQLRFGFHQFGNRDAGARDARDLFEELTFDGRERRAVGGGDGYEVDKRQLGRQERSVDGGGETL